MTESKFKKAPLSTVEKEKKAEEFMGFLEFENEFSKKGHCDEIVSNVF